MNNINQRISGDVTWNIIGSGADYATDINTRIETWIVAFNITWNATRIVIENSLRDICYVE